MVIGRFKMDIVTSPSRFLALRTDIHPMPILVGTLVCREPHIPVDTIRTVLGL
ncbi:hypothetical protein EVA_11646 [gut metagenome]|uniref:Uncharacterized protein n=1 Tax=gut metagenome TaxID=749906 RepID=J9FZ43_9ZZZZ